MNYVDARRPRSPFLIPASTFLLCLLLQIACASSVPAAAIPETSDHAPSAPIEETNRSVDVYSGATAAAILLRTHPRSDIELVSRSSGERRTWLLTQTGDVRALLANQHLLFAGWLIDQEARYYQLPATSASPDGRWLIEEGPNDAVEGLWLRQIDGAGERLLSVTGNTPLWSPDSQFIAFREESGIHVADIEDSSITPLNSTPDAIPLAWSPDHHSLLIQSGNRLNVQELASGQLRQLPLPANQLHGQPVWSQDGQTLYARYGRNQSMQIAGRQRVPASLIAFHLASESQHTIIAGSNGEGVLDFAISPDEESVVVWFATCRLAISQLVPIPVRSCTHELRMAATDGSAERVLTTLATDTSQFTAPQLGWLDWQPPAQLALDSPQHESTSTTTGAQVPTTPIQIPLVPLEESTSEDGYHFRIQSVLTATDALAYAEQAALTTQIPPPTPGYTQVAVLLRGQLENGRINLSGRSIKAVGAKGALYQAELLVGANGREGNYKQITLAAFEGEQTLGFVFVVPMSETLQALYIRVPSVDLAPFFLALHNEATIELPPNPFLPENVLGVGEPAPIGATVVAGDWEITFLPIAPENEPANETAAALREQYLSTEEGIATKARIRYIGEGAEGNTMIGCWERQSAFSGLDGTSVVPVPYQIMPNFTPLHYLCLLPGGLAEGWLLVEAPSDVTPSIAVTLPGTTPPQIRYFDVR